MALGIHRPQNDGGFFDATGDGGGVGGYDIAPWELDPTCVNLGIWLEARIAREMS